MHMEEFELERIQSLYENTVDLNLSDSGVHPFNLNTLLTPDEIAGLLQVELGYGWTSGAVELRQRIAALYKDRTPNEVLVTNGSAEANFLMVMTLLDPGDEIVLITPNYLQIRGWAKAIGITVREVPLRQDLGWLPDLAEVEAAVSPATKLITVCHPNNPTGAVLPLDAQQALVRIAQRHGLWLHADEVYKGAELAGEEPASFVDLYERAIVTNGLSKAMALPGLRIGWLTGPAAEITEAWARKDYTSITTSALSEHVATLVLETGRRARILQRSRTILSENLSVLNAWAGERNQFSLVPPRAGGMAFVHYDLPIGSTRFAHALREEKSVLVAPGDVYGLDGYLRIGIGAKPEHLQAGLDRISDYVAAQLS